MTKRCIGSENTITKQFQAKTVARILHGSERATLASGSGDLIEDGKLLSGVLRVEETGEDKVTGVKGPSAR